LSATTPRITRTSSDQLIPRPYDKYVDFGLTGYLRTKAFGEPLILKGAKGTGKTMAIEQFASEIGVPVVRHPCTEEDTARDLYGTFTLDGAFSLGSLTTAIDVANSEGACILVLEEINALSPRAQKMLNPLTDHRQEVVLPKAGHVFRVDPHSRLWVIGTMNPNYAGTYDINEDLMSRFTIINIGFMPKKKEMEILDKEFEAALGRQPNARERVLLRSLFELAEYTRSNTMGYSLSTRDLVAVMRSWAQHEDLSRPLKELEGKYEAAGLVEFQRRVASGLKIDLTSTELWVSPA